MRSAVRKVTAASRAATRKWPAPAIAKPFGHRRAGQQADHSSQQGQPAQEPARRAHPRHGLRVWRWPLPVSLGFPAADLPLPPRQRAGSVRERHHGLNSCAVPSPSPRNQEMRPRKRSRRTMSLARAAACAGAAVALVQQQPARLFGQIRAEVLQLRDDGANFLHRSVAGSRGRYPQCSKTRCAAGA